MQRLTKLSLRRNVEYNVQLLSINVHVINHFIIEPTLDYIIKSQLAKLSKFIPDEQIPKVVNSYLDAAISKATAKGSVNLFGFEFEATAFQNLKREIDNSLKNNVSHDERSA